MEDDDDSDDEQLGDKAAPEPEPTGDTTDEARAHAKANAARAMRRITEIMNAPRAPRGSAFQLQAAGRVLDLAGLGTSSGVNMDRLVKVLKSTLSADDALRVIKRLMGE